MTLTTIPAPESDRKTAAQIHRALDRLWFGPGLPVVALSLALGVIQVVGTYFSSRDETERDPLDAFGYALLVAGPALLLVRQRYTVAVTWAIAGLTLLYMLMGYPYGPIVLSVVVALFTAVNEGHRLAAWSAAAFLYFGHFGLTYALDLDGLPSTGQLLGVSAWLVVVLVVSEVVRARREWTAEARHAEEQEQRRRASEERLRIARELHDVLGHHISLINVQAGVALHLMDRQPEQAANALSAIERASREALSELRSVLDVLQQPDEAAPRSPAPGLAGLEGLASQTRAAGIAVETRLEGPPRPLPASVDAAAYRVVQEALTNVVRHASASSATVWVRYGEQDVEVAVEDDGKGGQGVGEGLGSGIAGMRARVSAVGGQFEAGPLPQRGFRVRAVLPLESVR